MSKPNGENDWQEFQNREIYERGQFFMRGGQLHSFIFAQQLNRDNMLYLFNLTDAIRQIEDVKVGADFLQTLLSDKRAVIHFGQESTRTRLSFEAACMILGMRFSTITDLKFSSQAKGESDFDTFQTLSEYHNLIISRNKQEGFAERMAWHLARTRRHAAVINAGSGADQHPTQAGLDFYTLYRSFNRQLDNLTISFVGDNQRGRTVRSLAYLCRNFNNMRLIFCAPSQHQIKEDILVFLKKHGIEYEVTADFRRAVREADAVYMTRIQDEHDADDGTHSQRFYEEYSFKEEHLSLLRHNAIVLHPLPRREELSPVVDDDPRVKIWSQVRNGMWLRAALIAYIFGVDKQIFANWPKLATNGQ